MREVLITKLYSYILHNNPELLIALQRAENVSRYLSEKIDTANDLLNWLLAENTPSYIIEEQCLALLTKDLRPSKFNYITGILEEDFEAVYHQFMESGVIIYEVVNLIEACKPVFEDMGFTEENEEDRRLRYAVTGTISEYLEEN